MTKLFTRILRLTTEPPRAASRALPIAVVLISGLCVYRISAVGNPYSVSVLQNAMINGMVVLSLTLIFGLSGQLSVGHAAFFGVGAYVTGGLATSFGWNFPWTLIGSALVGGAFGLLLVPVARLALHYFAMVTLALGLILYNLFGTLTDWTGGWSGLGGIPPLSLPGGVDLSSARATSGVVFLFLVVEYFFIRHIARSSSGRDLRAARDDELAAACLGIRTRVSKAEAAVLGCMWAGVAGSLTAHVNGFIGPESFGLLPSVYLILAVVIGGASSVLGGLLAGLGLPYLTQYLGRWPTVSPILYGALIVVLMLVAPGGFASAVRKVGSHLARRSRAGSMTEPVASSISPSQIAMSSGPPLPVASTAHAASLALECRGVTKSFGGVRAVRAVDLSVSKGSIHGLIGPNGAGKSSFLNVVSGVVRQDSGIVIFEGTDVSTTDISVRARGGLVRTFQNGRLFPSMTVYENVLCGAHPQRALGITREFLEPRSAKADATAARSWAQEVLDLAGLRDLGRREIGELAYGQRRLVEVARAVATRPHLLLLDEPAAGLAAPDRIRLRELLLTIRSSFDCTILFIEHDLPLVMDVCDEVSVLHDGVLLTTDTPSGVTGNSEVMAAYMGEPL